MIAETSDATETADPARDFRDGIRAATRVYLNPTQTIVVCLSRAMHEHGWDLATLVTECSRPPLGSNRAGTIVDRLRKASMRPPDGEPIQTVFQKWVQPLPWCGQCDDPRTRWLSVEGGVRRCDCWTDKPPDVS